MEIVYVRSSHLQAVGYDPITATLEIRFIDGAIYRYADVPEAIHAGLMAAQSKGGYFDRHIKPRYRYRKVR